MKWRDYKRKLREKGASRRVTSEYEGWPNWDTWHAKLMMDNEYDQYQHVQKAMRDGTWQHPDHLRDWAIPNVLGPYNQQQIADAQEWNTIPEDERVDHHYEDLKAKSPEAADLVDGLGMGADVSDTQPQLMDEGAVDWNHIWQHLLAEKQEAEEFEKGAPERERQEQEELQNHPASTWQAGQHLQDRDGAQAQVTAPMTSGGYLPMVHVAPGEKHDGQTFSLHPRALDNYGYHPVEAPQPQQHPDPGMDNTPGDMTIPQGWA